MVDAPGSRSYADATEKLRAAAKWLIAAAAGVGGVLVTGLQLGSLGELSLDHWPRIVVAITGLVLALAGVGVVIHYASALLTEDWITLGELSIEDFESRLNRRRKPRQGDVEVIYASIAAYGEELYGQVATSPEDLYRLLCDTNHQMRKRGVPNAPTADRSELADARIAEIRAAVNAVVEFANYRRTRADFEGLQRILMGAAALILIGVVAFAIAAHAPESGSSGEKAGTTSTSQTK